MPIKESFDWICDFCKDYHKYATKGSGIPQNHPIVLTAIEKLREIGEWIKLHRIDFAIEYPEGQGVFPVVPYVCALPPNQKVSNGIYVGLCFGRDGSGAVLGCAQSTTNPKGLLTVKRKERGKKPIIDVDGRRPETKYNNSFVNPLEILKHEFDEEVFKKHLLSSIEIAEHYLSLYSASTPMTINTPQDIISNFNIILSAIHFSAQQALPRKFISSLITKPFIILTGNSGTGKTKLAELLGQWLGDKEGTRLAVIPVGADWTDNRNVLGFVNHLRSTKTTSGGKEIELPIYQSTKVLDLLLDASHSANEAKPYFLILDEMNLSHVERYFADFLSTMESSDGGLLLHREGKEVKLPRRPDGPLEVPEMLPLPRNVFVIGTVNVDETTYMFSPKVLDRANVIEFRVADDAIDTFLKTGGPRIGKITSAPSGYPEAFLELSYRARGIKGPSLTLVADPEDLPDETKISLEKCRKTINHIFDLMKQHHQEFAFRSMAEILRFFAVDYELTADKAAWCWQSAMDAQILQKILPKLHGSKRKIGPLLAGLAKYCEQGNFDEAKILLDNESKAEAYRPVFPAAALITFNESYRKLCEMIKIIHRDQFVSFIQ